MGVDFLEERFLVFAARQEEGMAILSINQNGLFARSISWPWLSSREGRLALDRWVGFVEHRLLINSPFNMIHGPIKFLH
jgi:hypothetical protein